MVTAEYGGTGGAPIEGGMIVEEPDIEIGAGVSSKGMVFPPTCPSNAIEQLSDVFARSNESSDCD